MDLAKSIKQKVVDLGFDLVGITGAEPLSAEQVGYFAEWLEKGYHGQMGYMERNLEERSNPAKLLPNAKSVICTALNYRPRSACKMPEPKAAKGKIANYALYEDYHEFMKKRLYRLVDFITACVGEDFAFKVCVDSVPLAERALAARAGLGFIGKNHMLINPSLGSQLFLGEIITDLQLETDRPRQETCSECDKCIGACPTGALAPDGSFEADKCISYLTIEHKGTIPHQLSAKVGCRLFGCDECILACPYDTNGPICANKEFKFYPDRRWLNLQAILTWNRETFDKRLANSPARRCGLAKLKENAAICLANTAE